MPDCRVCCAIAVLVYSSFPSACHAMCIGLDAVFSVVAEHGVGHKFSSILHMATAVEIGGELFDCCGVQ